jgi:hypothetical protein
MAPMPGRQPEDWGIPLWEAIERWTPRELWERYREIAEYDISLIIRGGREDPRADEARRLRSRISEILVDRLVRGELIASGIAMPLKETSRRRDLRPELWPLLTFGYRFLAVSGTGLKYDQLLIREARPATRGASEAKQEAPRQGQPARRLRSRPGGPSIIPELEAEMRRRAASGELAPSLRTEAEALADWAAADERLASQRIPKPKSIEKKLSKVYRDLKGDKKSR